ncbi:MAG TPA: Fur family transcriptional regulator [Silvibacterium sp.]|jgi:Fe2+ or Zn2+ uptake regulation protein|nr:Fur family transcriptional regulator [Silvibacterium sp.]
MTVAEANEFRALCDTAGIPVTHQRLVIYQVLRSMHGHPSPEEVYERVRVRIPAISLATVYKNIHLFIESGLFHEVSLHHGSLRVETNALPHHHLVCTECKSITDIAADDLGIPVRAHRLRSGFLAQRYAVDVLGLCPDCQKSLP